VSSTRNQSPYPFIGRCIYCGNTDPADLSDEHCVPESLNGAFKLLKASCGACRDMTSEFEGNVTHHALGKLRAAMQYKTKSKRKKTRAKHYPVEVKINGEPTTVEMPVEAIVAIRPMLDAGLPRYLAEKHFAGYLNVPIGLKGVEWRAVYRSPEKTKAYLEEIGAESFNLNLSMSLNDFVRMIAKIAYCEAIATLQKEGLGGLEDIEQVYVLPLIRGDVSDLWRFIGTQRRIREPDDPATNPDAIFVSIKDGDILVHIQLFVPAGSDREYLVAVGSASEALRDRLRELGDHDV
jgi:hypothetical protein